MNTDEHSLNKNIRVGNLCLSVVSNLSSSRSSLTTLFIKLSRHSTLVLIFASGDLGKFRSANGLKSLGKRPLVFLCGRSEWVQGAQWRPIVKSRSHSGLTALGHAVNSARVLGAGIDANDSGKLPSQNPFPVCHWSGSAA